jgi:hypothetical protein
MFFLVASGAESWGAYLTNFFLPTVAGNIIGGVSLVAFLGHAQSSLARNPNLSRLSVPRFTAIHSLARGGVSSIEWVGLGGRNLTFCAHCR